MKQCLGGTASGEVTGRFGRSEALGHGFGERWTYARKGIGWMDRRGSSSRGGADAGAVASCAADADADCEWSFGRYRDRRDRGSFLRGARSARAYREWCFAV